MICALYQAKAKEKERKRAAERERRAAFRRGVEELIFAGRLPIKSTWKSAEKLIKEQSWFNTEQGTDFRAPELFADVLESIEEKIIASKEKFRKILKDKDVRIDHDSKFEDMWKKAGSAMEAGRITEVIAKELFQMQKDKAISAKKKEEKKIELAKEDFWDLLRRKEFGSRSKWSDAKVRKREKETHKRMRCMHFLFFSLTDRALFIYLFFRARLSFPPAPCIRS